MVFYCVTVCCPLTARTDDRTDLCIAYSMFRRPWEWSTEGKNINNNNNKTFVERRSVVASEPLAEQVSSIMHIAICSIEQVSF